MAYFDPNFHSLEEYIIPPPTVSVENNTYRDRTVVKVNGVNRHGIQADIVQALTDLDLIISKANISADGEYIMDVFHVTDELGNKLTESSQIRYIQESLFFAEGRGGETCRPPNEVRTCLNNLVGEGHLASDHAVLEMTVGGDHHGILSEVLATLLDLSFEVSSCVAWAHNGRVGFICCIVDGRRPLIPPGPARLSALEAQLKRVVEAHWYKGFEKWQVRVSGPSPERRHAERRLHQIMREDDEGEGMEALQSATVVTAVETEVSVNKMNNKKKKKEKKHNYMVEVNVRGRDRPKLFFDMVWTLEDLNYDVVHASASTEGAIAVQEYYIKKRDGWSRVTETEKRRLVGCLMAAGDRRPGPWVMRVEVRAMVYRNSLLWEVTRVLRECGMVVVGAKWAKLGDLAAGAFYVEGGSSTGDVAGMLMRELRGEIGGCRFQIKDGRL